MAFTHEEIRAALQNPILTKLDLSQSTLTAMQLENLANAFTSHPTLHFIRLWGNKLDAPATLQLFNIFHRMPHLRHLDIASWPANSEVIKVLSDFLATNPPLISLKLGHMRMTHIQNNYSEGIPSIQTTIVHNPETFVAALEKNTHLNELYLYENNFENKDIDLLCRTLSTHTSITAFTLRNAPLHDTGGEQPEMSKSGMASQAPILGAQAFVNLLASNSTLQKLTLLNCHLSTASICAIGQALIRNTHLKGLDLSDNELKPQGLEPFFHGIRKNHTLVTLRLDSNKLGDAGVALLVSALKKTKKHTIEEIGLVANGITDIGLKQMARLLNTSAYIKTLWLGANNITSIENLAEVIHRNTPLQHVDLTENTLGLDCLIPLATAMKNNTTVTLLDLYAPNSEMDLVFSNIQNLLASISYISNAEGRDQSFRDFFKSMYERQKDSFADPNEWLLTQIKSHLQNIPEKNLTQILQFVINDDYYQQILTAYNTIRNQTEKNSFRTVKHIPCGARSTTTAKVLNLENMKAEVKIAIDDYIATHNTKENPQLEITQGGTSGRRLSARDNKHESGCSARGFWSFLKIEWHTQEGIDRANSLLKYLAHQTSLLFALNVLLVFFQQEKNGNWNEESLKTILLAHLLRTFGYADCDITMDNDSAVNYIHALKRMADPTADCSGTNYEKMLEERPRFLV